MLVAIVLPAADGIGKAARNEVYALKHADLTAVQEAVARKIVTELNAFDNLYFEVANEPYFNGITTRRHPTRWPRSSTTRLPAAGTRRSGSSCGSSRSPSTPSTSSG